MKMSSSPVFHMDELLLVKFLFKKKKKKKKRKDDPTNATTIFITFIKTILHVKL